MKTFILLILLNVSVAMAETTGCQYCIDYCVSVGAQTGQTAASCTQTCQSLSYSDCPVASPSPVASSSPLPPLPPTPPPGYTTITPTPTPYPTTAAAPVTGYPAPPVPPPMPLPPVPYGWPRAEINLTAGSCYAHGYRLGNNDVSPTFVSVSYSCDGASDNSSIINITGGNANGSVGVVFYDPNNVITCLGGAEPDMQRNVYTGVLACDSGKTYPITFY